MSLTYSQNFLLLDKIRSSLYRIHLDDLKESPSLRESSHVTFGRMARYSSLTVLHIFRKTVKSYQESSLLATVLKFMFRVVKR